VSSAASDSQRADTESERGDGGYVHDAPHAGGGDVQERGGVGGVPGRLGGVVQRLPTGANGSQQQHDSDDESVDVTDGYIPGSWLL
jgi:hypothetical protein